MVTSRGQPLRVLHVAPYLPPERIGGVGEVVAHVHRELLRRGHRSEVLTTGGDQTDPLIHRIAAGPARMVYASAAEAGFARRFDLVHMHHGEGLGLLAATKLRGRDVPFLLTLHASAAVMRRSMGSYWIEGHRIPSESSSIHRGMRMRIRHVLDKVAMRLADQVTFISRSTAHDFLSPERAANARVVYNGLPATEASTMASPPPVDLLYVGVYSVLKRVHMLPLVLAHVRSKRPASRLRIIGFRADDHPDFRLIAERVGVADALVFEGALRSEEIVPYYRAARVLLVPSVCEGLPMVVLEALREGLPCVATMVSGHPEVIEDGRNGLLVALDRPVDMADAALRILNNPTAANRMGEFGRATIESRFTVQRQVNEYLEVYYQLLGEQPVTRN